MKLTALQMLLLYFAVINFAGFAAMGLDKRKAQRRSMRTPESVLFLYALLGGSIGCIIGMHIFRHKTRKMKFRVGLPLILLLQVGSAAALYLTSGSIQFR